MPRTDRTLSNLRGSAALAAAAAGIMLLAACGSSSQETSSPGSVAPAAATGTLSSICPSTVKIQSSWYPQPAKGALYQLVGANGAVDTKNGSYSAEVDGVTISVLAGDRKSVV